MKVVYCGLLGHPTHPAPPQVCSTPQYPVKAKKAVEERRKVRAKEKRPLWRNGITRTACVMCLNQVIACSAPGSGATAGARAGELGRDL